MTRTLYLKLWQFTCFNFFRNIYSDEYTLMHINYSLLQWNIYIKILPIIILIILILIQNFFNMYIHTCFLYFSGETTQAGYHAGYNNISIYNIYIF